MSEGCLGAGGWRLALVVSSSGGVLYFWFQHDTFSTSKVCTFSTVDVLLVVYIAGLCTYWSRLRRLRRKGGNPNTLPPPPRTQHPTPNSTMFDSRQHTNTTLEVTDETGNANILNTTLPSGTRDDVCRLLTRMVVHERWKETASTKKRKQQRQRFGNDCR